LLCFYLLNLFNQIHVFLLQITALLLGESLSVSVEPHLLIDIRMRDFQLPDFFPHIDDVCP
jgi:hypothetical protein